MASILKVPYLGTAEEDVLLSTWLVGEGEAVHRGQSVAAVETLKASFEVEAERDGVLARHLVPAGTRLPLQAPLAVVTEAGESVTDAQVAELLATEEPSGAAPAQPAADRPGAPEPGTSGRQGAPAAPAPHSTATGRPAAASPSPGPSSESGERRKAAPAARQRARELAIDLSAVPGTGPGGLVRLADVEAFVARAGTRDGGAGGVPAAGDASAAAASRGVVGDGTLDPAFLAHLRREGEAFAALSSDFKLDLYRRHGARIGDDCHLGPGALLRAERLLLGDGSHVGAGVRVDAVEFVAGRLLFLGPRCSVRCRRVVLGDNAYFAADVEIGGGGATDPEAELVVGSHGFVGEHVHLNPCRRLQLGDEVVVSRGAVIMTHSFGGSVLAGYPNRFAGVTVGDGCQIGIGATLFPGTEMGAGSILLSGSSLVSAVPPGRLFGGVPAVDLKAAARAPSPEELSRLLADLVGEFARQLGLRGFPVRQTAHGDELRVEVTQGRAVHRLRHAYVAAFADADLCAEELRVALQWSDAAWEARPPEVVAIDLSGRRIAGQPGPLGSAFREFLRKRGVRLSPRAWTYRGGWL